MLIVDAHGGCWCETNLMISPPTFEAEAVYLEFPGVKQG